MKKNLKRMIFVLVIGAVLFSACNSTPDNGTENGASEQDLINQAYTQAALTSVYEQSLTLAAQPSITPTPISSPTSMVLATNTSIASPTTFVIPTLAPPPTFTSIPSSGGGGTTGGRPCLRAELLYENHRDGSKFKPGESIAKLWILGNSGTCSWTGDFSLVHVDGPQLSGRSVYYFSELADIPDTGIPNGSKIEITISMEAPLIPGQYKQIFMLRAASGELFGLGDLGQDAFWIDIIVRE